MHIFSAEIRKNNLLQKPPIHRASYENLHAIDAFQNNMAELFCAAKFSIRKTIDVSKECLNIITKYKGKI